MKRHLVTLLSQLKSNNSLKKFGATINQLLENEDYNIYFAGNAANSRNAGSIPSIF
jgi:hypothetical protein